MKFTTMRCCRCGRSFSFHFAHGMLKPAALAVAIAAAVLAGCDSPSLRDLDLPPASGKSTLALVPSTVNLITGGSILFMATGGKAPYTLSVDRGTYLPQGTASWEYTAPEDPGTYIVTVTDANGNSTDSTVMATASIPLSVRPPSITVTVGTTVTLVASGGGGTGTYLYTTEGPGILIQNGDAATYEPVSAEIDRRIYVVSGSESVSASITSTSVIPGVLQISPSAVSLTTGDTLTFAALEGTGPYTYSIMAGTGTVDPSTGEFTAAPVAETCTVRVTDDVGGVSDATVDVYYPLTIVPTDVYVVTEGTYTFSASGGKTPYVYSYTGPGSIVQDIVQDNVFCEYTAPDASGSDIIWVEDAFHNKSYATVHVFDPASYWDIHAVDTELKSGQHVSLALDADDLPHVAYYESTGKELRLASYDGAWSSQVVDGTTGSVGLYPSLALDPTTGYPCISYYDADPRNRDLRFAAWTGLDWSWVRVDDGDGGNVGLYTSLALDPATGHPRISYYDATNRDLKYAAWNGTTWDIEAVDEGGDVGKHSSLALDPATGWPRIAYYDATNRMLKYAAWDGTGWQITNPDPGADRGEYCSLAMDDAGDPHISYYDAASSALRYSWKDGAWQSEEVDADNDRGMYSSIALDTLSGLPRISYFDNTVRKVMFATYDGGWTLDGSIDPSLNVGMYSSLKLTTGGDAVIAYYNNSAQDLKVAVQP